MFLSRPPRDTGTGAALVFSGGGYRAPVTVRRAAGAAGMRLAVDPRDGAVRLTLPRRAALKPALLWAESQRAWVEQALAKLPATAPLGPGTEIPFEGALLIVDWQPAASRTVRRDG